MRPKSILRIREIVPGLEEEEIGAIRRMVRPGEFHSLEFHLPEEAEELKSRLEEIGLTVRFIPYENLRDYWK